MLLLKAKVTPYCCNALLRKDMDSLELEEWLLDAVLEFTHSNKIQPCIKS